MSFNKASKDEKEVIKKYLFQFLNIEKQFPLLPGIKNTEALAGLMGITEEEYTRLNDRFNSSARHAATELLEDSEVNDWLDDLPFNNDDTIVALGDSLTGDRQSWF